MRTLRRILCRIGLHFLSPQGSWFYEGCATEHATGFECRWCGCDWAIVSSYIGHWWAPPRIVKRTLAKRIEDERKKHEMYSSLFASLCHIPRRKPARKLVLVKGEME